MKKLKRALLRFKRRLPPYGRRDWLFLIIPMILFCSLCMGIGPYLQQHVFALVASDAPNIYDGAYRENWPLVPGVGGWILSSFHPYYVLMSLVVMYYSLKARDMKDLIFRITLSFSLVYTLYDLIWVIAGREEIIQLMVRNVVANITGGVLFGVISVAVLAVATTASVHVMHQAGTQDRYFSSIIVLLSLVISLAAYYGVRLFYQPLPINVSLTTDQPFRGIYSSSWVLPTYGADGHKHEITFTPDSLPAESALEMSGLVHRVAWTGPSGQYSVYVSAYAGCNDRTLTTLLSEDQKRQPWSAADGSITTSGAGVLTVKSQDISRLTGEASIASFWANQAEDEFGFAQTLTRDDRLEMTARESTAVVHRLSLRENAGGRRKAIPRSVELADSSRSTTIRFVPHRSAREEHTGCSSLELPPLSTTGKITSTILSPSSTVHVVYQFVRNDRSEEEEPSPPLNFTFKGERVLVALPVTGESMGESELGQLHMVSVAASNGKLRADDEVRDISSERHFVIWGELDATYHQTALNISSESAFVWVDSKRLHQTRWEKLPPEWQISLVTGFLAAMGYLLTKSSAYLRGFWARAPRNLI